MVARAIRRDHQGIDETSDHADTATDRQSPATNGDWPRWNVAHWQGSGGDWPGRYHHHGPRRRTRDRGPIRRSADERMIAGVAGGLSRRIGRDPTLVRIVILVSGLSGFGIGLYVLAWLLLPADGETDTIAKRAMEDRRGLTIAALVFLPTLAIALLIGSALGVAWIGEEATTAFVAGAGLLLIWRNGSPSEKALLHRAAQPLVQVVQPPDSAQGSSRLLIRVLGGVAVGIGGLVLLLIGHATTRAARPIAGLLLIIAAIIVIFGPWWLRVARELVVERQARARAEERADLAARVHDSVLQTLALIQRRADQPQQVVQLARAQERELRSWLFNGEVPGSAGAQDATFSAGVHRIQGEVETLHGVPVDAVVVGDCELDDGLRALLAAGREAAINAAKWSGASSVSLFGEVEATDVSLFVRDRGVGFDPEAVGTDRKGIAESVRGRMTRQGGTAVIRSEIGHGTEVALTMGREAGRRPRNGAPA
ncbi:MAG TPA: PspC domain-containing protein [Acidimicrobiales bacterium]|nr:PspC domain-containing protein [Acidimicrobiales bacterium]